MAVPTRGGRSSRTATASATTHLRAVDATKGPENFAQETLGRLHAYAVALSAREVTPKWVGAEWPEFFELALAFAQRHGNIESLDALSRTSVLDPEQNGGHRGALNGAERRCFLLLARDPT